MANQLEQLRSMTAIVADTGDIDAIARHRPDDATTNPSLLLKAAASPRYAPLLDEAVAWARGQSDDPARRLTDALDKLAVNAGVEILKLVPDRVSTEADARLSFDTAATVAKARRLIGLYEAAGIDRKRVLIKIASTWEGIRAGEILEREGIHCNLTLLFGFGQAVACAEAGVTLISPFVGRIFDWSKAHGGDATPNPEDDPGVRSVQAIYQYFKEYGYATTVMGASFRNKGEILALAGCDRLTISPALMDELSASDEPVPRRLSYDGPVLARPEAMTEARFRWDLNEDAMATEKLAEGIRSFTADQIKLEKTLAERL
ncbi:MAG: transaldolase [Gallionellaceae bacterium]|nr:transaldolase [Gallionellaceae bacterium]